MGLTSRRCPGKADVQILDGFGTTGPARFRLPPDNIEDGQFKDSGATGAAQALSSQAEGGSSGRT